MSSKIRVGSAPQLLHRYLGCPKPSDCDVSDVGSCWVCGCGYDSGVDARKWLSGAMTDQNQCRDPDAEYVCSACVYFRARTSEVPGRLPGPCSKCRGQNAAACLKCEGTGKNAAGGNYRNYTHMFDAGAGEYTTASKGEKPTILAFLRREKRGVWFAAIADSGQKHVLPYAPINSAGVEGVVLFDDLLVTVPDAAEWELADAMALLLTAGATKEEIASGRYGSAAWSRCAQTIRMFEARWRTKRDGAFFTLCLWLSQRNEEVVQARLQEEKLTMKQKKNENAVRAARAQTKGRVKWARCNRIQAAESCVSKN